MDFDGVETAEVFQLPKSMQGTADIILHSAEGTDFPAHSYLLSAASSFFESMFAIPQPSSTSSTAGLPKVPMPDTADVISALLQFIYPVAKPTLGTLEEVGRLLKVSQKYDIPIAVTWLRRDLTNFIEAEPLAVYTICCNMGFKEEARMAETAALKMNYDTVLQKSCEKGVGGELLAENLAPLLMRRRKWMQESKALLKRILKEHDYITLYPQCTACGELFTWPEHWANRAAAQLQDVPDIDKVFSWDFVAISIFSASRCPAKHCSRPMSNINTTGATVGWSFELLERLRKDLEATWAKISAI